MNFIFCSTKTFLSLQEHSSVENDTPVDVGEEWELPYREKRRKNAKPDTITVTLPARGISTLLAATTTATKTSVRLELKLTSTLSKAGGADINQASLSVSTVYRQRKNR